MTQNENEHAANVAQLNAFRSRITAAYIELKELGTRLPGGDRESIVSQAMRVVAEIAILPAAIHEAARLTASARVEYLKARYDEVVHTLTQLQSERNLIDTSAIDEMRRVKPNLSDVEIGKWQSMGEWEAREYSKQVVAFRAQRVELSDRMNGLVKERESILHEIVSTWHGTGNEPESWRATCPNLYADAVVAEH